MKERSWESRWRLASAVAGAAEKTAALFKMPPPAVTNVRLHVLTVPGYRRQPGAPGTLITTVLRVEIDMGGNPKVAVPPALLPFGLLDRVSVHAEDVAEAATFILHITRLLGTRSSKVTKVARSVSLTDARMSLDGEGRHEHFKAVLSETGHEMRYRMVPACTVLGVLVEFTTPPPEKVALEFWGANVLMPGTTLAEAVEAARFQTAIPFRFPPLAPSTRKASAELTRARMFSAKDEDEVSSGGGGGDRASAAGSSSRK